nr:MAG TPA: minor capsid protein [Caudoviricetes sp.]
MKSRNGVFPMLRAEEIEALRDAATDLLRPVIEYLLRDIAERVAKAGQLTATAQYETWKLQQLGVSQRDLRNYLKKALKVSNAKLKQLLTQSAEAGYNYDLSSLPTVRAIPFDENEAVQQIVRAVIAQTQGTLENLTQTLGMVDPYGNVNPLRDTYRKCMDYAFEQVSSGAVDYNTAIREATRNLAAKGVEYIDYESGVTTSLEAAVRRNIMGALGLMQEQISQYNHDQYGATGWEIDAHSNSAPDHEPIQGKQYTDAEYEALNNSLVRRIGTLNCGHSAHPIVYGASIPQYTPEELEEMRQKNEKGITFRGKHYTGYEATQRQRRLERAIRAQKRKILIDKATGDAEKLETDQIKLQLLQQDYKAFSKAAGLRTQNERLEKVGFAWKEATESRKVAESHYREWSKSIGADNSIKTLAEYYDVKYNDSPRYELLQRYARDVDSGWISPLSRFDNYEALYNQIQTEIVGTTANNGVVITGQSQHFMQRVIGTMVDPQKLRDNLQIIRRSGVDINSIKDTLYNPVEVCPIRVSQSGQKSVKLNGKNCSVTINPDTGILIQTNPRKEE